MSGKKTAKAQIGDRVRIKLGATKRMGQLATVIGTASIVRERYGAGSYIRYEIRPDGETKSLFVPAGHFDLVDAPQA